ncbi:MAG TPA: hypothetical protein VGV37_01225 [Aliidongia sp.]|uniref:hypothetical protein n=1 Tax=Aliidongia sp. TaxID=1914230 RepID=UPI002DDCBF1E|nr:hypothetical protein [Aliidongia sp.]HEV2673129.1 hypothetical protein [Aliidongia sp.]
MPMSMASALTRLELDPWDEASRLAALPSASAVTAISHMIGRTSGLVSVPSEIPKLSARLVGLLGKGRAAAPAAKPVLSRPTLAKTMLGKIVFRGRTWQLDGRWLVVAFAIGVVVIASRLILIG